MKKLALALAVIVGALSGCIVYDNPDRYGDRHDGDRYSRDRDRGVPERYDRDRDGVPDRDDRRPNDPYRN